MNKQIIIIGGGISGLSVLHHLVKKYAERDDIHIRLLEKESRTGGTIRSVSRNGNLFEEGPNGFLNSKDATLKLIEELDLHDDLVIASPESNLRYISLGQHLCALPVGPAGLLRFKPMSLKDKLRIPLEFFIPKGRNPLETVYEFGKRRLGENFSKYLLDPMVKGIFAGDSRRLHLRSAFPRIHELEQTHGSLLKGMLHLMKQKKAASKKAKVTGQPAGQLCSLKKGMAQLTDTMTHRYQEYVHTGEEAMSLAKSGAGYVVETREVKYFADAVFLCTPAYGTAQIVKSLNPHLASTLADIPYPPVAVVGLVYRKASFKEVPKGFGYLIPSSEKKAVMGTLFTSAIFADRTNEDHVLLRIMIGGVQNPDIIQKSESDLLTVAKDEIQNIFHVTDDPIEHFMTVWPQAIPQYNTEYPDQRKKIDEELTKYPHCHFVANYLDGISINDCTANAKLNVVKFPF